RTCEGHECINGRWDTNDRLIQQGCQLELYVPTIQSNMDCTLCLDCAKACPYDNVALTTRPPGDELFRQTWPNRLDLALLAILAAWGGLINAFAMTPPVYELERWLARLLNTRQEVWVLGLIFVAGVIVIPLGLSFGAAWLNRATARGAAAPTLARGVMRYAYSFVPLGFGIWAAHYLFHLLIGPLTIWPALQTFWVEVTGVALMGQPNWSAGALWMPPLRVIQTIQMAAMAVGTAGALAVAWRAARRSQVESRAALIQVAPWALILLVL